MADHRIMTASHLIFTMPSTPHLLASDGFGCLLPQPPPDPPKFPHFPLKAACVGRPFSGSSQLLQKLSEGQLVCAVHVCCVVHTHVHTNVHVEGYLDLLCKQNMFIRTLYYVRMCVCVYTIHTYACKYVRKCIRSATWSELPGVYIIVRI